MYRVCAECYRIDPSEIEGSTIPNCRYCKSDHLWAITVETYREILKLQTEYLNHNWVITNKWRNDIAEIGIQHLNRIVVLVTTGEGNHEISV